MALLTTVGVVALTGPGVFICLALAPHVLCLPIAAVMLVATPGHWSEGEREREREREREKESMCVIESK